MGKNKDIQIVYKAPINVKRYYGLLEIFHLEKVWERWAMNDIVILLYDNIK